MKQLINYEKAYFKKQLENIHEGFHSLLVNSPLVLQQNLNNFVIGFSMHKIHIYNCLNIELWGRLSIQLLYMRAVTEIQNLQNENKVCR